MFWLNLVFIAVILFGIGVWIMERYFPTAAATPTGQALGTASDAIQDAIVKTLRETATILDNLHTKMSQPATTAPPVVTPAVTPSASVTVTPVDPNATHVVVKA